MASCRDVASFLQSVGSRNVTAPLPGPDMALLQKVGVIQVLDAEQYGQLINELGTLGPAQAAIQQEQAQRAAVAAREGNEVAKTQSFLFRFEGAQHQAADRAQLKADADSVSAMDVDLANRSREFSELLAKKSLADVLSTFEGGYIGLTGLGTLALRDLGTRLYRVSDLDFSTYWAQAQAIEAELEDIAGRSGAILATVAQNAPRENVDLGGVQPSYLWAIAIGMAKLGGDVGGRAQSFLDAYAALKPLSPNVENRLMAAEVIASLGRAPQETVPMLSELQGLVRKEGVDQQSSLGVASVLLAGRRADGTFPLDAFHALSGATASQEARALLAVVNRPLQDLLGKFQYLRSMFGSWGFSPSEDVELASAYLAVSDLPADSIGLKLSIVTRGLAAYLQYPLVGSAILTSIPVMEANETLTLLERAYELLGQRTGPMSQAEIISLAVRMVHGVKVPGVNEIDPTAAAAASPVRFTYPVNQPFLWFPVIIGHGFYYNSYGMGGFHPAHAHLAGGFVG